MWGQSKVGNHDKRLAKPGTRLYRGRTAKSRKASRELTAFRKKQKEQVDKTREDLARARPRPSKEFDENVKAMEREKDDTPWARLGVRVEVEVHAWLAAAAMEKNASISEVIEALVYCARDHKHFAMERRWSAVEKIFYQAELRKQNRLKDLQVKRQMFKELLDTDLPENWPNGRPTPHNKDTVPDPGVRTRTPES